MNIVLIYFSIKYKGDWDKIYQALEAKERIEHKELIELEEKLKDIDYKVVTLIDQDYPEKLKNSYKPPFVIWMKGNYKLLDKKLIALTGDEANKTTQERIKEFVPIFEKKYNIISTSFKGVDQHVYKAAKKGVVFVLANGLNDPYINDQYTKDDLLLTEYPLDVHVKKDRFKNRNRLYAAFASSLVLFSSKKDGGINNAVVNFLNIGKDIYCFPGDGSKDDGNSELIKQGASLITHPKDIE